MKRIFALLFYALLVGGSLSCRAIRNDRGDIGIKSYEIRIQNDSKNKRFVVEITSKSRISTCLDIRGSATPAGVVNYDFPGVAFIEGREIQVESELLGVSLGSSAVLIPRMGSHQFFVNYENFGSAGMGSALSEASLRYHPEIRNCDHFKYRFPTNEIPSNSQ